MLKRIVKSELFRNIVLYGLIGAFAAGVDLLIFRVLVYNFAWPELIANGFSVIVGISISFTLNRYFNFRVKNKTALRYLSFFIVGMCGLTLSEAMLLFGSWLGFDPFNIKLVSVVIVACFQFTLNKMISFRKSKPVSE